MADIQPDQQRKPVDNDGSSLEQLSDEQLVGLIRDGRQEAYRALVERHKNYVFTLIVRMIEHRQNAEDLAQEVFIRMYRSLGAFRGDAKFSTWLYRLTVNLVTDYRRSQRRNPVVSWLDKVKAIYGDRKQEPEQQALKNEEQQLVRKLLAGLPDKYRTALYLYHYQQMSYQEIAEVLNLPIKTVETRLYRGKALLREQWLEASGNDPIAQAKTSESKR